MLKLLSIALGGALGAVIRYWASGFAHRFLSSGFPWGTLCVNLTGSLVIGLLWGVFETVLVSHNLRLFVFIGFLGSFTTFSTFSLENFHLLRDGEYMLMMLNISLSFVLGIFLVFAGFFASRFLMAALK